MEKLKDKNLYYVGGVVRDEILGTKSFDTDFCYEGNAIEYGRNNFTDNIVKVNADFGTIRLNLDEKEIDIASTREETYPKSGHLPLVKNIGCSLEKDLKRRDFTINAMAKNTVTGEIIDLFGGKSDIGKKLIRVLHNDSFIDDPTRIVRALKFSVRFGFELSDETKQLQDKYLENINYDMSYHRLKKELVETFNLNSALAFDRFVEHGIYKLLGNVQNEPKIRGKQILAAVNCNEISDCWIIYLSFFNLSNLPLTKKEKNIIMWADKLAVSKPTNNTPKESLIIYNLRRMTEC